MTVWFRLLCMGLSMLAVLPMTTEALGETQTDTFSYINHITSIDVKGDVDIVFKHKSVFQVRVGRQSAMPVHFYAHRHTLYIQAPNTCLSTSHCLSRPMVYIETPDLNQLKADGSIRVVGKNMVSHGLSILAGGSSHIHLFGHIILNHVQGSGLSQIDIRGIRSTELSIHATDHSAIWLSGYAKHLAIRLNHAAMFNGGKLQGQDVQVQVIGEASALVVPIAALHAFVSGAGVVYYKQGWENGHPLPRFLGEYTSQHGNLFPITG